MKANEYRAMVIFDKQVEFFEKLMPVLHEVNCYVTTLDVWCGDKGKDTGQAFKKALKKSDCVKALQELLDQYYIYVPEALSNEISQLHLQSIKLENSSTQEAIAACAELLFGLQDNIRKYINSAG